MKPVADVIALVACLDQGRRLELTLDDLRNQTRPPLETTVVELGSTDPNTIACLQTRARAGVGVVRPDTRQIARGWNEGLARSEATLVLLLPSGARLPSSLLEQAERELDSAGDCDFLVLSPGVDADDPRAWPAVLTPVALLSSTARRPIALFRRTLWQRLNGFDESLSGLAGVDLLISGVAQGGCGRTLAAGPGFEQGNWPPHDHLAAASRLFRKHEGFLAAATGCTRRSSA